MPKSKATAADDENMDETQFRIKRLKTLAAESAAGVVTYPHKFQVSLSIPDYIKKYEAIGRLTSIRNSVNRIFCDLVSSGQKVQVIVDSGIMDEAKLLKFGSDIKRFDHVGIVGFPGRSKSGELSIFARSFTGLSYCLHAMPKRKKKYMSTTKKHEVWTPGRPRNPDEYILKDQEIRYRKHHLDLMLNSDVARIFDTKAKVISYIRRFLEGLKFREVKTPILIPVASGGAACPLETYYKDFKMYMFLRIAPELYLKQLIVGGMERVYEIGEQFRNEGIDATHNPEFTTCEFYMAYADYNDLMDLTENMISGMVKELTGGYKVAYHANGYDNDPIEIDFTPPFRRICMIEELEKMAELNIPKDLASDEANQYLADACLKFDIICPPPKTTTRLLNKLVGHFLEETCDIPTFIIDHPEIMSPLAKSLPFKAGMTERFEFYVNKFELINAYCELNNPLEQRQRFANQRKDQQLGDEEAMNSDDAFCEALEYGMPPTAGWGLGIDRLTLLLTDSLNIKEVILFPAMKPKAPTNDIASKVKGQDNKAAVAEASKMLNKLLTWATIKMPKYADRINRIVNEIKEDLTL